MNRLTSLAIATVFALSTSVAFADHHASGEKGMGDKGEKHGKMLDCSKVTDDAKRAGCEAHQAAAAVCKDTKGADHKKCMTDNMPKKEEKK